MNRRHGRTTRALLRANPAPSTLTYTERFSQINGGEHDSSLPHVPNHIAVHRRGGTSRLGKGMDLKRAVANLRIEMGRNDRNQDPWDWPELSFVLDKEPDLTLQHCASSGSLQPALVDVPKANWGTRPAVVLDILDRLAYQALVDRVSVQLIGCLTPNAYGWRLPGVSPSPGIYSHNMA